MKKTLLTIISLLMLCNGVTAQELTAEQKLALFVRNVNLFNKAYPQEKVYLHFDNTGYFIGENMWFKAFVVAGPLHTPSPLSKVLYVELLTPEGRIVQSCKLKVENGQAHGRFQLGHLLHAGYYEVRAYTRMMLNWDESGVFSRVFPIFDKAKTTQDYISPKMTLPQRSQKIPEERQKNDYKVKKMNMLFFPEGGTLVAGLQQRIAFKVFSEDGIGQDVKGMVVDADGNTFAQFATDHNGIGTFNIVAYEDSKYKAKFTLDGKEYSFALPKAMSNGYAIGITERDSSLSVMVQRNIQDENDTVGLAISNGGNVFIFERADFNDDQFIITIEKDALRDGVNQFMLFNQDGQPLAQRMIFHRPTGGAAFSAKFDKKSYKPFDKVTMDFELRDTDGKPVATTFSLSVRDKDTNLPGSHTGNILNNLLLSSDLKGFIEDIDWYFEADDAIHNRAIDNLMLTQGWYRYNWQQMSHPNGFHVTHYIEDGLMISGKLSSVFRNKDKVGSQITVILYDTVKGQTLKGRAVTDSVGHFAFLSEDFYGRWQMFISTKDNTKRKEMNVHLDRQISPDSRAYEPLDTWMYLAKSKKDEEEENKADQGPDRRKLDKYKYENLIPETVITAEKRWMEGTAIKSANIVYDLDEERTREDDTGELYLETLFDYLERNNKYFTFDLDSNGRHTCYYKMREIQWIIDNDDYSLTDIEDINAKDVEAILINDKFGSAFQVRHYKDLKNVVDGSGTESGSIENSSQENSTSEGTSGETPDYNKMADSINKKVLVYLYIDKNAKRDRKGERNTVVQGYTKYVDFYSPDYEALVLPDEKDYRRTLYWNPTLKTSADGKGKAVFYNNGQCTDIEAEAATVTPSGGIATVSIEN